MTEEVFKQALHLRQKISYAKSRVKHYMSREDWNNKHGILEDYYSKKVTEWTFKLDDYRLRFKAL